MAQKRRPEAGEWFGRADQFWNAGQFVGKEQPALITPTVVCHAFAAEAYLKCLLTIRGRPFPDDHSLRRLFGLLSSEDKRTIETAWNKVSLPYVLALSEAPLSTQFPGGLPVTFKQTLKHAADAFKDWRYMTDGKSVFSLGNFSMDVREVILQTHPDWRNDPPDFFGRQSKDRAQRIAAGQSLGWFHVMCQPPEDPLPSA